LIPNRCTPAFVSYLKTLPSPARPSIDWAAELAARSWRLQPHGPGLCAVIQMVPHGWSYVPPKECVGRAEVTISGGMVCSSCHSALTFNTTHPAALA
jgi:hypothetical protein